MVIGGSWESPWWLLLVFATKFWEVVGSTNSVLLVYDCSLRSYYIYRWWGHLNLFFSFLLESCPFLGPLIPLFWTSGDISSGLVECFLPQHIGGMLLTSAYWWNASYLSILMECFCSFFDQVVGALL